MKRPEIKYIAVGLLAALFVVLSSCGGKEEEEARRNAELADCARLTELLRPEPRRESPWTAHLDSMPPRGIKLKINSLGKPLAKIFTDSNYLHQRAARSIGIAPITSPADIWQLRRPLVKIESNEYLFVDNLNHSHPYLVPEAADLLYDIAKAFHDSLQARGGGAYRLKITSVLRTPETVSRLRRRNRNAIEGSAHMYGTTFDISYSKFICDSDAKPRTQADLKNLLAEVLNDFRNDDHCYIKFERRLPCFHITARP